MFDGLKDGLIRWGAGRVFREIHDGHYGPTLQLAYANTQAVATQTGFLLTLVLAALTHFDPPLGIMLLPFVAPIAGVLLVGGLIHKGWKLEPPPLWFGEAFSKVMSFGPLASAIVAAAVNVLGLFDACARCAVFANDIDLVAAAVASVTGWLAAYLAPRPLILNPGVPPAA